MSALHSGDTAEAIELGKVSGVWGVRGAIKVYSYTREREGIAKYKNWILQSANRFAAAAPCGFPTGADTGDVKRLVK